MKTPFIANHSLISNFVLHREKMKKYLLTTIALLASFGIQAQVKEFGWLAGTWQEKGKSNFEVWSVKGTTIKASSYQQDTSGNKKVTEEIEIIKKDGKFFFVPNVAENRDVVYFEITSFDKNGFVAENPQHDFPKKIRYRKTGKALQASIEGDKKVITFQFQKVK